MRRLIVVLVAVALGLMYAPAAHGAQKIFVDDSSCPSGSGTKADPYCTIQAAVNAAASGDSIIVRAGLYPETVTVMKTLTFQGAQAGIEATKGRTSAVRESIVSGHDGGFVLQANDITVDGFTAQEAYNTGISSFASGIWTDTHFSGYRLLNNIVQMNTIGITLASSAGDTTVVSGNRIVNNNEPGSAAGNGIYADQSLGSGTITNNVFRNNSSAAIFISAGTGTAGVQIIRNQADTPILLYNTLNSTVKHNKLLNSSGSALFVGDNNDHLAILKNTITSPVYQGIRFRLDFGSDPSENVTVSGNSVKGAAIEGIYLGQDAVTDSTFTGNTVAGSTDHGLLVEDGSVDNAFNGNTFKNSASGIDIEDESSGSGTEGTGNEYTNVSCGSSDPDDLCTV